MVIKVRVSPTDTHINIHTCTQYTAHTHFTRIYSIPDPHVCHRPIITLILNIVTLLRKHVMSDICVPLHTGMMLKENNTLKRQYLQGCGLQPEGLEEVIKGVQVNTKLEILDLSYYTIDNKRASYLGKNDIM